MGLWSMQAHGSFDAVDFVVVVVDVAAVIAIAFMFLFCAADLIVYEM